MRMTRADTEFFQWFRDNQVQELGSSTPLLSALPTPTPQNLSSPTLEHMDSHSTATVSHSLRGSAWRCPLKVDSGAICAHEIAGGDKTSLAEHFEWHVRNIGLAVRNGVSSPFMESHIIR